MAGNFRQASILSAFVVGLLVPATSAEGDHEVDWCIVAEQERIFVAYHDYILEHEPVDVRTDQRSRLEVWARFPDAHYPDVTDERHAWITCLLGGADTVYGCYHANAASGWGFVECLRALAIRW